MEETPRRTINFYRAGDTWGLFSNFYASPVYLDEKRWPTTEHYFQAQKFLEERYQEEIRRAPKPRDAANLGRRRDWPLRKDWEEIKEDVMERALMAKFTQHNELRAQLLSTGDAHLVEHTTNDRYWGDGGGDGAGRNRLGFLLEKVRGRIVAEQVGQ
eukprot:gnl/Trimastix_PCT/1981.p2 GENE.gnl/Trimastix_PCT/1981~~gnl/Trimastix_PCT/1981.p2  ORF type:complete len:182 (-),score=23.35 gnl/Trimastix_PCT/1981:43-513(-)